MNKRLSVKRVEALNRLMSQRCSDSTNHERPQIRFSPTAEEPRIHRPSSAVPPLRSGPVPAVLLQETGPPSAVLLRRTDRGRADARAVSFARSWSVIRLG